MSPLIDLGAYLKEVDAFARLASDFVDKASSLRLEDIARELRTQVLGEAPAIRWETRAPIRFEPSTKYDGPAKTNLEANFSLSFECSFIRSTKAPKRSTVWRLSNSAIHVTIDHVDGPSLRFHFDNKNAGQWGPQMHFQIHEEMCNLAIPRIATSAFLPTDCADLMLSELHQEDWQKRQLKSNTDVSEMRNGQEYRTRSYLQDIATQWRDNTHFTRVSMLQSYTTALEALPSANQKVPKAVGW